MDGVIAEAGRSFAPCPQDNRKRGNGGTTRAARGTPLQGNEGRAYVIRPYGGTKDGRMQYAPTGETVKRGNECGGYKFG